MKGAVDVFQSRWFEEQITRETRTLEDAGFGSMHWMPKGPTREASLQAMREAMLRHKQKLVAGVFVGGMEGLVEEFELFPRFQPTVPRVSLVGPGGAAAKLPLEEARSVLGEHVMSRRYPFLASVLVGRLGAMA